MPIEDDCPVVCVSVPSMSDLNGYCVAHYVWAMCRWYWKDTNSTTHELVCLLPLTRLSTKSWRENKDAPNLLSIKASTKAFYCTIKSASLPNVKRLSGPVLLKHKTAKVKVDAHNFRSLFARGHETRLCHTVIRC